MSDNLWTGENSHGSRRRGFPKSGTVVDEPMETSKDNRATQSLDRTLRVVLWKVDIYGDLPYILEELSLKSVLNESEEDHLCVKW